MKFSRRHAILGAVAASMLPHAARAQSNGLDILLENLSEEISRREFPFPFSTRAYLNEFLPTMTKTAWDRLLVRKLIPTEPDRGYRDGRNFLMVGRRHVMAVNRPLAARHTFDLAYDGCMGCGNGRNWQHDNKRCDAKIKRITDLFYADSAAEAALEHDQHILSILYYWATKHPTIERNVRSTIRTIAHQMNPRGRWVVINQDVASAHFGVTDIKVLSEPIGYLDDLPVFVHEYATNTVLIGHDGSEDESILWSPHLLLNPCGTIIDPYTFEPSLPFSKRHGIWFDRERAAKHFVTADVLL